MLIQDYTKALKLEKGRGDISLQLAQLYLESLPPQVAVELSQNFEDSPEFQIQTAVERSDKIFLATQSSMTKGAIFLQRNFDNNPGKIYIAELFAECAEDQKSVMGALLTRAARWTRSSQLQAMFVLAVTTSDEKLFLEHGFSTIDPDNENSLMKRDLA